MYAVDVSKKQWSFDVEVITPEIASRILAMCNIKNRKLRPGVVEKYAIMMAQGDWKLSPEAIAISRTGRLLNGQHRLSAVVKANVPARFLVIRGLDDDVFDVLDRGAPRSTADALQTERRVTEAARLFLALENGNTRGINDPDVGRVIDRIAETHRELMEFCNTSAPMFSTTPFRLAAVARIMSGCDKTYVMSVYRNLVLANLDDLPPVGRAVIKMHLNGNLRSASGLGSQFKTIGLAWAIFDPRRRDNTRVAYPQTKQHIDDMKDAVNYGRA